MWKPVAISCFWHLPKVSFPFWLNIKQSVQCFKPDDFLWPNEYLWTSKKYTSLIQNFSFSLFICCFFWLCLCLIFVLQIWLVNYDDTIQSLRQGEKLLFPPISIEERVSDPLLMSKYRWRVGQTSCFSPFPVTCDS